MYFAFEINSEIFKCIIWDILQNILQNISEWLPFSGILRSNTMKVGYKFDSHYLKRDYARFGNLRY